MASRWTNFLNSLATSGGNLFLLVVFSLIFVCASVVLMLKFGPTVPAVLLLTGLVGTFTGALVGILRGSRDDNNNQPPAPPKA